MCPPPPPYVQDDPSPSSLSLSLFTRIESFLDFSSLVSSRRFLALGLTLHGCVTSLSFSRRSSFLSCLAFPLSPWRLSVTGDFGHLLKVLTLTCERGKRASSNSPTWGCLFKVLCLFHRSRTVTPMHYPVGFPLHMLPLSRSKDEVDSLESPANSLENSLHVAWPKGLLESLLLSTTRSTWDIWLLSMHHIFLLLKSEILYLYESWDRKEKHWGRVERTSWRFQRSEFLLAWKSF